jgi:hypothetical protein
MFAHPILHVDLGGAVARPGRGEGLERAVSFELFQLVAVEKVSCLALVAEEQPRLADLGAGAPLGLAVPEEGAAGRAKPWAFWT